MTPRLIYGGFHGASTGHFLGHIVNHFVSDSRIRFRMIDEQECVRPHIKLFVNGMNTRHLSQPLDVGDEVVIVAALSGG